MATGRDRGGDTGLCLIVRHEQIDVDAVALGTRGIHLLEPERWSLMVVILQVLTHLSVPEYSAPERHDFGDHERVDRDLDGLKSSQVDRRSHVARRHRDPLGQRKVVFTESAFGVAPQTHRHPLGSEIQIGTLTSSVDQATDRFHQGKASSERSYMETR